MGDCLAGITILPATTRMALYSFLAERSKNEETAAYFRQKWARAGKEHNEVLLKRKNAEIASLDAKINAERTNINSVEAQEEQSVQFLSEEQREAFYGSPEFDKMESDIERFQERINKLQETREVRESDAEEITSELEIFQEYVEFTEQRRTTRGNAAAFSMSVVGDEREKKSLLKDSSAAGQEITEADRARLLFEQRIKKRREETRRRAEERRTTSPAAVNREQNKADRVLRIREKLNAAKGAGSAAGIGPAPAYPLPVSPAVAGVYNPVSYTHAAYQQAGRGPVIVLSDAHSSYSTSSDASASVAAMSNYQH